MSPNAPVVTRMRVARLYNTAPYEHERIEVTIEALGYETAEGQPVICRIKDPGAVLTEVREILDEIRPNQMGAEAELGRNLASGRLKIRQESDPWESDSCTPAEAELYEKELDYWNKLEAKRKAALARLAELGSVTIGGAR